MKTTIYRVEGGSFEDAFYVATLREARQCVKEGATSITRCIVADIRPRRDLVCRLLNGESWAREQESVA